MPIEVAQIAASEDDGDVDASRSSDSDYTRTFIIGQATGGASWWWHFYRWSLDIEPLSTINSAIVELYSYSGNDDPHGYWYADANTNSQSLIDDPKFQQRTFSTNFVEAFEETVGINWWSPPDVAAILQEIIDSPGWASGNYFGLTYQPQHEAPTEPFYIRSWEFDPTLSAKITVDYTPPPAAIPPYLSETSQILTSGNVTHDVFTGSLKSQVHTPGSAEGQA